MGAGTLSPSLADGPAKILALSAMEARLILAGGPSACGTRLEKPTLDRCLGYDRLRPIADLRTLFVEGCMDFRATLNPASYGDDVEICIAAEGASASDQWISEQLFYRAVNLGRAYGLHNLSRLDQTREMNAAQADGLVAELEFLSTLLDRDAALSQALARLIAASVACVRTGEEARLVIGLP
jgi:hypothetical protein